MKICDAKSCASDEKATPARQASRFFKKHPLYSGLAAHLESNSLEFLENRGKKMKPTEIYSSLSAILEEMHDAHRQ